MKGKNDLGRVLLSVVIATIMIVPVGLAYAATNNGNSDNNDKIIDKPSVIKTIDISDNTTPPYDWSNPWQPNEDNRYDGTNESDPYHDDRVNNRTIPPDVDVTYLNMPDPTRPHDTSETDVVATVTNWDDEAHEAKIFLQVYKEIKPDPATQWCDDMECAYTQWTTEDRDGDGDTWALSDARAHSGSYSWHCSRVNNVGYGGNEDNWLISPVITIPDDVSMAWLNFSMWVQGEMNQFYPGYYEFTDYLEVYVNVSGTGWQVLGTYGDTNGEWAYPEQVIDDWASIFYDFYGFYYNATHDRGLGIRLPAGAGDTVQFAFVWRSDPAYCYEGAWIDDVCLLVQHGSMQPLVWQEYKPVTGTIHLEAFGTKGFQKEVKFHLPFTPENDTTYFFEVYSELVDAEDVDGHYDANGSYKTDAKTGATYWDPENGVNESIYFGIWHDAAALDVSVQPEVELENCAEETTEVPITVVVKNNGTVTETIPVRVAVRERIKKTIFWDDLESGTLDNWQGGYTSNDNAPDFYWGLSDWDPHSGQYHLFCGDARGFLHEWMQQAILTYMNGGNGWTPTGDEVAVMFTYWAQWKMDAEGNPNFPMPPTGWIYSQDYDKWGPILEDPVGNAFLGTFPSRYLGYVVSGHSNDQYYGPTSPGAYINPWDDPSTNPYGLGSTYSRSLFEIDMLPTIEYYQPASIEFGWLVSTDESGLPDLTYPGDLWSGLKIDDVEIYAYYPGPVVWTSDPQYVTLEPGETATLHFIWNADRYGEFVIDAFTELEGDWNTGTEWDNDHAYNTTYVYSIVYTDDLEDEHTYDNWASEDNTIHTPSQYATIVDNCKVGTCEEDHYWYIGEEDGTYPAGADVILQMVNPDSENGSFNLTACCSASLDFWLYANADDGWDYLTIEVSNNSGLDWYLLSVPPEDWYFWQPDPTYGYQGWMHYVIPLFNCTDPATENLTVYTGFDPILGYLGPVNMSVSDLDDVHFRFHFLSDASWNLEGIYIDDVYLNCSRNVTTYWDGVSHNWTWVHEVIFHDDMEDAEASAEKWITYDGSPVGDLWHLSDHNPHSGTHKWWCADEKSWSSYNKHLVDDGYGYNAIVYDSDPMRYRNNMEDNLTLTLDTSGLYHAEFIYWENYSFADANDYGIVYVSTDGGATWRQAGGTASTNSGGWIEHTIQLDPYLPNEQLLIRFSFVSNDTGTDIGWEIDDISVRAWQDCVAPTTTAILDPPEPDGCNGWYTSPVTVTLVANDNLEVDATYYSIDGGSWLKYTAPFTINVDGEHTISYYSVDTVGNVEDTHTISFKIDTTAPSASITYPQAGYIYLMGRQLFKNPLGGTFIIGKMTFQADASDATSGVKNVHFTIGDAEYDDTSAPYEVFWHNFDWLPTKYTVTVTATDNACNTGASDSLDFTHWL